MVGCMHAYTHAGGHYPAPVAILDSIKHGFDHPKPAVRIFFFQSHPIKRLGS